MSRNAHALEVSESESLITALETARLLRVHISTVRRWIKQGKLPAYRVGGKGVRVRYGDVQKLIAPIGESQQKARRMDKAEPFAIRPLTEEEQQRAFAAIEGARKLQDEFRAKYGTMVPESWELLNESREERTQQLMRAADE